MAGENPPEISNRSLFHDNKWGWALFLGDIGVNVAIQVGKLILLALGGELALGYLIAEQLAAFSLAIVMAHQIVFQGKRLLGSLGIIKNRSTETRLKDCIEENTLLKRRIVRLSPDTNRQIADYLPQDQPSQRSRK